MEKSSFQSSPGAMTLTEEVAHTFLHSAVQQPIDGISQIVDRMFNTSLQSNFQLISAPTAADFGTARWHAQQVGAALGMTTDYLLVRKVMKGSSKEALRKVESAPLSAKVGNAAVSGAAYESLFRPSDPKHNLLTARLKQGVEGAATFATLSATTLGLGQALGSTGRLAEVAVGTVAGASAGVISAQLSSVLDGKGLASATESVKSAYTFGIVGGTLGGLHTIGRRTNSSSAEVQMRGAETRTAEVPVRHTEVPVRHTIESSLDSLWSLDLSAKKPTAVPASNEVKVRVSELSSITPPLTYAEKLAWLDQKTYYKWVPDGLRLQQVRTPTQIWLDHNAEPSIVFGEGGVEAIRYPRGIELGAKQRLDLAAGYAELIVTDGQARKAASEIRRQSIGFVSQEITAVATLQQMQANAVNGALEYIMGRSGNRFTKYLIERYGPMTGHS